MSCVVTGFYTPDYAEIAANLIKSLDAHAAPHRIYPVEKLGASWIAQPLRKPEIIKRCMEDFPDRTVIFMDADCTLHGDISPLLEGVKDVGFHLYQTPRGPQRGQIFPSSHVVVCRPTEATKTLIEVWHQKCDATIKSLMSVNGSPRTLWSRGLVADNDEKLLLDAISETPHLNVCMLPAHFAGVGNASNALITHDSARNKFAPPPKGPSLLKRTRRRLIEIAVRKPYAEWKYGTVTEQRSPTHSK